MNTVTMLGPVDVVFPPVPNGEPALFNNKNWNKLSLMLGSKSHAQLSVFGGGGEIAYLSHYADLQSGIIPDRDN